VYLGEKTGDSGLAMRFISQSRSMMQWRTSSPALVEALSSFLQRPWFKRIWVIQEVLFSRSAVVVCGSRSFDWGCIKTLYSWHMAHHWIPPTVPLPFMVTNTADSFAAWSKVKAINKYITFDSLISGLNKTRRCQATDPLDKVYPLLPLLSLAGFEIDLVPNYEHSPARVYTDFATILMEQQGFDWLEAVGGRSGLEGLPSWVPDWTIPLSEDVLPGPYKSIEETRARRTLSIPRPVVRKDPALGTTCLETTGEPFGRIKRLSSTYIPGLDSFPKSDHFPLAQRRGTGIQPPRRNGRHVESTLALQYNGRLGNEIVRLYHNCRSWMETRTHCRLH
jgi:hypothetical protein